MRSERLALAVVNGRDWPVGRENIQRFRETTVRSGNHVMWVIQGGRADPAPRREAPVAVPALPAIDRAALAGLPLPTLVELQLQARQLVAEIDAAVTLALASPSAHHDDDRAVGIKEAAEILGVSADFLYDDVPRRDGRGGRIKRWQELGGYREGRAIKFSLARLRDHVRNGGA
jgi:hypothetical protein